MELAASTSAVMTEKRKPRRKDIKKAKIPDPNAITTFDIVGLLPMHLAKQILGRLDFSELEIIKLVSNTWRSLAIFVRRDKEHRRDADDGLLNMQVAPDPTYAGKETVVVPHPRRRNAGQSFEASVSNIFCGPYSVITVDGTRKEVGRKAHYVGGKYVLTGSKSKVARLWDARSGTLSRTFHGHAGRIEAVHINEAHCAVLTGSSPAKRRMHVYWPHIRYDTSIRMWNTTTGKCEAIFGGEHKSTIICIDANYDAGIMLAGSSDKHMSLWRLPNRGYRKPSRGPAVNQTSTKAQLHYGMEGQGSSTKPMLINSFLHDGEVRAVCIFRDSLSGVCTAVSGTDTGSLRLFNLDDGTLMRLIPQAHTAAITCLDLDAHRVYSGGLDRFVNVHAAASVEPRTDDGNNDVASISIDIADDDVDVGGGGKDDQEAPRAIKPKVLFIPTESPDDGMKVSKLGMPVREVMAVVNFKNVAIAPPPETPGTEDSENVATMMREMLLETEVASHVTAEPEIPRKGSAEAVKEPEPELGRISIQSDSSEFEVDAPLIFMRHTTEVLCLQKQEERMVTGSQDGKVRIWSVTTGTCIRIFRGNSKCDPIVGITFLNGDSMCVNTLTSMHVFWFDTGEAPNSTDDGMTKTESSRKTSAVSCMSVSPEAQRKASTKTSMVGSMKVSSARLSSRAGIMEFGAEPVAKEPRIIQARMPRPGTAQTFSGQWRSDAILRRTRPGTAPAGSRKHAPTSKTLFEAESIYHLHDGCVSIEMMEAEHAAYSAPKPGRVPPRPATAAPRMSSSRSSRSSRGSRGSRGSSSRTNVDGTPVHSAPFCF